MHYNDFIERLKSVVIIDKNESITHPINSACWYDDRAFGQGAQSYFNASANHYVGDRLPQVLLL